MISASHNPAEDNGIKFFGPDGYKLSDQAEIEIEKLIEEGVKPAQAQNIGRARRVDDARFRYGERVKSSLSRDLRLDGLKVVVDCANGAAHRTAPEVLWELGADVIPVGIAPNGKNINLNCGSTNPQLAAETVVAHGADVGICLDGDADRVVMVDEHGQVADGDREGPLSVAAGAALAGAFAGLFVVVLPGFFMRRMEFQADRVAVEMLGDGELLVDALTKLAELNKQPLDARSWSHPTMQARIDAIRALARNDAPN